MLTRVHAHLHEIGIHKALDRHLREIKLQFLTKAVVLFLLDSPSVRSIIGLGIPIVHPLLHRLCQLHHLIITAWPTPSKHSWVIY